MYLRACIAKISANCWGCNLANCWSKIQLIFLTSLLAISLMFWATAGTHSLNLIAELNCDGNEYFHFYKYSPSMPILIQLKLINEHLMRELKHFIIRMTKCQIQLKNEQKDGKFSKVSNLIKISFQQKFNFWFIYRQKPPKMMWKWAARARGAPANIMFSRYIFV